MRAWLLGAIALGALSWIAAPAMMDIGYDGNTYVATGHGWSKTGELILQWGDVLTFAPAPPGHSHHFPPAYPVYLGIVFALFGYGLVQAKIAAVVAGFLTLGVIYLTTRDLYGHARALVVAALFALSPWMLWIIGMGFSETLALLFFTLTMWAILKSLADERYIALAGIFAGVAYLSRASMGIFFVIAGMGGLAWRLRHRGFRATLTSRWYALAILFFGLIIGLWAWRNVALYGWPNWETSPGSRGIPRWIWEHKFNFSLGLLVRAPLFLAVIAPLLALLWPETRRSLARIRDEHTSGLWLSIGLLYVLGIIFSAAYFSMGVSMFEALRLDNARYVLVALTPVAWALIREADVDAPAFQRRVLALLAILAVGGLLVATFPAQSLGGQAARAIDDELRPGDRIAIGGSGKYAFYAYLSHPENVTVYTQWTQGPNDTPEFIFSYYEQAPPNYTRVLEARQGHWWWPAKDEYIAVWVRDDVMAARAIDPDPMRAGW